MPIRDARIDFSVAKWDYSQRYPADKEAYIDPDEHDPDKPSFSTSDGKADSAMKFNWQVTADGVVELHL